VSRTSLRTIGLLLCKSRSGPIVEYAPQNLIQPIGVSTYRVTRELPEPVRQELRSVEDLQEVVNKLRSEMEMLRKELADEEWALRPPEATNSSPPVNCAIGYCHNLVFLTLILILERFLPSE